MRKPFSPRAPWLKFIQPILSVKATSRRIRPYKSDERFDWRRGNPKQVHPGRRQEVAASAPAWQTVGRLKIRRDRPLGRC